MGYSNNKWRKILTILMIINLCFILFAKFTKVFGATFSSSNLGNIEIEVPDWLNDYNVLITCFNNTNNYYRISVNYCDKSYKIYDRPTQAPNQFCYINSSSPVTVYYYSTGIKQGAQTVADLVKNITQSDFSSSTIDPESANTPLCRWVGKIGTATRTDYHYNFNVYNWSDNTVNTESNLQFIKYPEIANSLSDLETLNFDVVSINAWDWSNKDFDVLFYDRNNVDSSTTDGLYPKRVITVNKNTPYYKESLSADPDKNAIFWIPIEETGLNFYVGGNYEIRLAERQTLDPPVFGATYTYNYLGEPVEFTISSNTTQDRIDSINKQIEETTQKKYHDETINSINNINNNINNLNNSMNNVNDALTNTTPDANISSDINNSLNFNNQNQGLNNLNGGFFSRLTSMLSNLLGYNLAEDTSVNLPMPNSNKTITLHSKDIYDNVTGAIRLIINAFWVYIFSFYMWRFINKIYIAVSTGNILDTFSSSGEAITNDML